MGIQWQVVVTAVEQEGEEEDKNLVVVEGWDQELLLDLFSFNFVHKESLEEEKDLFYFLQKNQQLEALKYELELVRKYNNICSYI